MNNNIVMSILILLLSVFNISVHAKAPSSSLKLTKAEKKFLLQNRTIRIHSEKDWAPYNYTQFQKAKGYSNEYMRLLANKLGIKLEYVYGKSLPTYIRMLEQKKIDIISNIEQKNIKNNKVIFSYKPIIIVPMSILTKKDQTKYSDFKNLKSKKIAITQDMFSTKDKKNNYTSFIRKNHLNIKLAYKDDMKSTVDMVSKGSVSAALATHGFFNHYMKNNNIKGLVSTPLINNQYLKPLHYHIAIRNDWALLKSSLDKAMKAVTAKELKYLDDKWLQAKKVVPRPVVKKEPVPKPKPVVKKVEPKPVVKKVEPKPVVKKEPAPKPKPIVKKVEPKPVVKKEPAPKPKPVVKKVEPKPVVEKISEVQKVINKEEIVENKKVEPTNIESKYSLQNPSLYMMISAITTLLLFILFFIYLSVRKKFSKLKLETDELKNQQDDVEHASQAKSDHLAQISHEIRTPINAVLGMSLLALETDLNDKQHGYVSKIHNSANMLLNLVNQILDFSKLEAGKMPLDIVEFNLNSVFENLSDIIQLKADEKGLDIIFDVENEVPVHLLGDSMRINQILTNLTSNALKFTQEGEIFVYAKVVKKDKKKITLEFVVKDTGIGIKEEHLKKLFKEYQQAEDSTASTYGGTGLGLLISKNLINQMGGDIRIESVFGEGTSFIFTLELDLPEKNELRKYRLPTKESMNKKILIIDISKASSEALYKKLAYFHFDITVCDSWEATLEEFVKNNAYFDLIFVNAKTFEKNLVKECVDRLSKEQSRIIFVAYNLSQLSKEEIITIDSPIFLERPYSHQKLFDMLIHLELNEDNNANSKNEKSKLDLESISGSKILLAEDNKINQSIIQGMLDETGLKITIANNGLEALKTLHKDSNFDLVLMDINMPVVNGYEAVKLMRKDEEFKNIPIIALSASILENDILLSKEAGMNDHLGKPIMVDEFFKMLLKYIKPKQNNDKITLTKSEIINIKEGTERVGGDYDFYKIIIADFIKEYNHSDEKLKELLEKDIEKAKLYLHDVKGVCANISANRFYEFISAFEPILHNNLDTDFEEYLKTYKVELDKLIKEMDRIISS